MLPSKYWAEMGWRDFAAADMSKVVAVLPVAAIEQHGPHLPVGVDTFINEGYLARAVERVPDDMPVLFLPVQAIGKSNEHIEFPGTLTLSLETVTRAWIEIGDSVARAGCRKLIVMNSHGGNVPVIAAVVRELRVRHRMLAVHAAWHALGYPEGLFSAEERAHGIHGGDAETSLMLAFKPELVRMREAREFRQRGGCDRSGVQAASRHPADRHGLDVERPARIGRGRRRLKRDRGQGRSLRRMRRRRFSGTAARRAGLRCRSPRPGTARSALGRSSAAPSLTAGPPPRPRSPCQRRPTRSGWA